MQPKSNKSKSTYELVKELRTDNDMSQKDLAKRIDVSESTLSRIEQGKHSITIEQLMKFAEAFNVTPQFLLGLDSDKSKYTRTFMEKLIKQFGITTEDYDNDNNGVFAPDDFIFSMPGDYLVLTAKKEFFELFEYLARESGVKLKRPPKEYKRLVDSAVKRFEKSVKSKEKCSYFFVSKKQMEKLIEERARSQVKAEKAIEGVVARALASDENPEETPNEG